MDANDKLYKQTQVQRALEREVRKQKRECMMLDAAGDHGGVRGGIGQAEADREAQAESIT